MSKIAEELTSVNAWKGQIAAALERLRSSAATHDFAGESTSFQKIRDALLQDSFRVIVAGRFKNGKSTLLNALLSDTTCPVAEMSNRDEPGPMATAGAPCTAV